MWIINDDGFFSAVQDWDNADRLVVRSRSDTDLHAFVAVVQSTVGDSEWQAEVVHTPERDYEWRVATPRQLWSEYLATKANDIDYGNFKNHCAEIWDSTERDFVNERLRVLNDAWLLFNHWPNGELF